MQTEKGTKKGREIFAGAELSRNSSDADGNSSLFSLESASLYFCPFQEHMIAPCSYLSRRISSFLSLSLSLARAIPEFTASPF
jgi:hypothetical protein